MSIEKRESDGAAMVPPKGVVGPGGDILPSSLGEPRPGPRSILSEQQVIAEVLMTGEPFNHPDTRRWQMQWARAVLFSPTRETPYRVLVACRVIIAFSTQEAERAVATRIKADMERKLRGEIGWWRPEMQWIYVALIGVMGLTIVWLVLTVAEASS